MLGGGGDFCSPSHSPLLQKVPHTLDQAVVCACVLVFDDDDDLGGKVVLKVVEFVVWFGSSCPHSSRLLGRWGLMLSVSDQVLPTVSSVRHDLQRCLGKICGMLIMLLKWRKCCNTVDPP